MRKHILFIILLCFSCIVMIYSTPVIAADIDTFSSDRVVEDNDQITVTPQWVTINGDYYYQQKDGSILKTSGIVKIDKYKYCLGEDGERLVGFNKIKGKWYYFNPQNGRLLEKVGWKKIKGKKYYIQKGGRLATGVKKIGKVLYGFTSKGVLRGFSGPFKYKGKYYRTNKKGVAEKLSNIQVKCSKETRKYIKKYTSAKMSNKEKFRYMYNKVLVGNYASECISRKEIEAKGFQYRIAHKVLSNNGRYNCYGFACTIASIAKELGYEPYVIIMEEDHAVVMINGKYYDNMGAGFGVDKPILSDYKTYKKVKF